MLIKRLLYDSIGMPNQTIQQQAQAPVVPEQADAKAIATQAATTAPVNTATAPVQYDNPVSTQAKAINPGGATVVRGNVEGVIKDVLVKNDLPGQKIKPRDAMKVREPAALTRYKAEHQQRQAEIAEAQRQAEIEEQQRIEAEEAAKQESPYTQLYRALYGDQEPETPEQREAREKRERAGMTISNLSDALAHVANLWGTSKGALSTNLSSLSKASHDRIEKAREIRQRNDDAWRRGMYQAMQADKQESRQMKRHEQQMTQKQAEMDYKMNKDKAEQEWKEEERDWKRKLQEEKDKLAAAKEERDIKAHNARIKQIEAQIDQGWARTNAYTKDLQSRSGTQRVGGKDIKTVHFAMSDGSGISVPADLEKDYYADVFVQIASAVEQKNEENKSKGEKEKMILEDLFFDYEKYGEIAASSRMKDAVHTYAKQFPEIEDYMKQRASEMWSSYYDSVDESEIAEPSMPAPTHQTSNQSEVAAPTQKEEPSNQTETSYPNQQDIAIPGTTSGAATKQDTARQVIEELSEKELEELFPVVG